MWFKIPCVIYDGLFEEEDRESRKRRQILDHIFESSHITVKDALFTSYKEEECSWKLQFVSKGSRASRIYVIYQGAVSVIGHQHFATDFPDERVPMRQNYTSHSHKHAILGSQFVLGLHESRTKSLFNYDLVVDDSNTILFSFEADFFWMLAKSDWGFAKSIRDKEEEFNHSIKKGFPRPKPQMVIAPKNSTDEQSQDVSLIGIFSKLSSHMVKFGEKDKGRVESATAGIHCCSIAREKSLTKLKRGEEMKGLQLEGVNLDAQVGKLQGELEVVKGRKIKDLLNLMDKRKQGLLLHENSNETTIGEVINAKSLNKYNMSFHSNLFRRDQFAGDIRDEHKRKYALSFDAMSPRIANNPASSFCSDANPSNAQQNPTWNTTFKPNRLKRFGFKKTRSLAAQDSGTQLEEMKMEADARITNLSSFQDETNAQTGVHKFSSFVLEIPDNQKKEHLELKLNYKQLVCMRQRPNSYKSRQSRYTVFDNNQRATSCRTSQYETLTRSMNKPRWQKSVLQLQQSGIKGDSVLSSPKRRNLDSINADAQGYPDSRIEDALNNPPDNHDEHRLDVSAKGQLKSLLTGHTYRREASEHKRGYPDYQGHRRTQEAQSNQRSPNISIAYTSVPDPSVRKPGENKEVDNQKVLQTPLKLKSLNTTETKATIRAYQVSGLGARLSKPFSEKKRTLLRSYTREGWQTETKQRPTPPGEQTLSPEAPQAARPNTKSVPKVGRSLLETLQQGAQEAEQLTERICGNGNDLLDEQTRVKRRTSGRRVVVRPADERKMRGVLVINDF